MIELPECQIVGVFGPVASGKTHLVKKWVDSLNRVVVVDGTGEFVEANMTQVWASPAQLHRTLKASPWVFRVCYQPGPDLEEDFGWVLRCLWVHQTDKYLVVDEFHSICPNNAAIPDVQMMLRYARHAKLGFIGVSQRIADVHKLFTSSCRMIVLFWTQEARDIDAIGDRWGSDVANKVANLRPLIYDDVNEVTRQVPQCMVIMKGSLHGPQIYDFQTETFIGATASLPNREDSDNRNTEGLDEREPGDGVPDMPVSGLPEQ